MPFLQVTGRGLLHEAVSLNNMVGVQCLVEDLHAPIDAVDFEGTTPLMVATTFNRTAIVGYLLDHGADVSVKTSFGATAETLAAEYGLDDMVQLLRQRSNGGAAGVSRDSAGAHVNDATAAEEDSPVGAGAVGDGDGGGGDGGGDDTGAGSGAGAGAADGFTTTTTTTTSKATQRHRVEDTNADAWWGTGDEDWLYASMSSSRAAAAQAAKDAAEAKEREAAEALERGSLRCTPFVHTFLINPPRRFPSFHR